MKNRIIALLLVFVLCGSLFVGCSAQNAGADEQVYVYGTAQEPGSLNPNAADEPYGYSIYQNVYNRLVKSTNSFDIVPDLAKSWEYEDDASALTFHLYPNVKWHDGEPFTSADVKWTFDTIITQRGYAAASFSNVSEITCPDDNTVIFHFSTPDSSLLSTLTGLGVFIMPKHIYDGTDWLTNGANNEPIGTGPFKFSEWVSGESITLVRNEEYFGSVPKLDKAVFKFIPDGNTAYMAWLNDEIDWYDWYPADEVEKLRGNEDYVIVEKKTANVAYLIFNTTKEPFSDPTVREVFALAVDRNEILERAYHGVGTPSEYHIPSVFSNYTDENYRLPERDTEKAHALMQSAGYTPDADGFYLTVDFEYFSLDNYEDMAIVLKEQLAEVGINLNLQLIEYTTWQEKVLNNRDFTMTLMSGNQGPTVHGTLSRFNPESATCIASYENAEMSQAILAATGAAGDEALQAAFTDIQRILSEENIIVPIMEKLEFVPLKANIHGHPLNDAFETASADELTYVYFD